MFGLVFLYAWLVVDPRLIYHSFWRLESYPSFFLHWPFIREFLSRPGGLTDCAARFLSQWYYYSWPGALVIALTACGISWCTGALLTLSGGGRPKVLLYAPALLVAMMYGRQDHPLAECLALFAALAFSVVYAKAGPRGATGRAALFLVLCGTSYYVAGAASLVLALSVAVLEIFARKRPLLGGLYVLIGLAVPGLFGALVFGVLPKEAYSVLTPFLGKARSLPTDTRIMAQALCLFAPAAILAGALWKGRRSKERPPAKAVSRSRKKPSAAKAATPGPRRESARRAAGVGGLVLVTVASLVLSYDGREKRLNAIACLSQQEKWSDLIDRARRLPPRLFHPLLAHDINRALYYTGRLGDEMFSFLQQPGALLLLYPSAAEPRSAQRLVKAGEVSLELGDVARAEVIDCEALEVQGDSPRVLEDLAVISLVRNEVETARVFLNLLSKDVIHGARARDMLRRTENAAGLASDPRIQRLRSLRPEHDYPFTTAAAPEPFLTSLLAVNSHNRMAFEYLTAHYLLSRQLDKFVENLAWLDDFQIGRLPRHYEEAVLMYTFRTGKTADLGRRSVSAESLERFKAMNRAAKGLMNDPKALRSAWAPEYGRTYFFYFLFEMSGVTQ